jgi:LysM repeat protein
MLTWERKIKMIKPPRLFLVTMSVLTFSLLASCSLGSKNAQADMATLATPTIAPTTIELTAHADAASLSGSGQIIQYIYTVKNTGTVAVPGIIELTNATCPQVNTVGNLDGNLDPGESVTCTSQYAVVQADIDSGSVSNTMTASVNGIKSNVATTKVDKNPPAALNLTKTANPVTYSKVGDMITYTYVIMNSGTANLGPAQFTVTDAGISAPINCGDANATLAPAATLSCTTIYAITQADVDAGSVTTNATASGGGAAVSPPAGATITKSGSTTATVTPAANNTNFTAGSTIQHKVVSGEWLWQIARCYGADPAKTLQANPQLRDPRHISPDMVVTVPNIGSVSTIYGPPCVVTYTVQDGDTWVTIAQKYNADPLVLQMVNANSLAVGRVIKVPINSAGGAATLSK